YGPHGEQIWVAQTPFGADTTTGMAVDGSGNVYVTGDSGNGNPIESYAFTVKYDSLGHMLWNDSISAPRGEPSFGNSGIALDPTGNVLVAGAGRVIDDEAAGTSTLVQAYLVKYSPAGAQIWRNDFVATNAVAENVSTIKVDGAGNSYVAATA